MTEPELWICDFIRDKPKREAVEKNQQEMMAAEIVKTNLEYPIITWKQHKKV